MTNTHSPGSDLLDPDAFRQFYDTTLPVVFGYLRRRCSDVQIAEDLTQDAFMSAIASLRKGQDPLDRTAWIVAIARRRLIDHYRRDSRRSRLRQRLKHRGIEPAPDAAADIDAMDSCVATAINRLPAMQRAAVVLRYMDDQSVVDVAVTLGKSYQATESLLARGRKALVRDLTADLERST